MTRRKIGGGIIAIAVKTSKKVLKTKTWFVYALLT
jgi:hypothetical protein